MIQNYPLFVTLAIAATFSPGPAVVLAMSNSFRYGTQKALMGILGNVTAQTIKILAEKTGVCTVIQLYQRRYFCLVWGLFALFLMDSGF